MSDEDVKRVVDAVQARFPVADAGASTPRSATRSTSSSRASRPTPEELQAAVEGAGVGVREVREEQGLTAGTTLVRGHHAGHPREDRARPHRPLRRGEAGRPARRVRRPRRRPRAAQPGLQGGALRDGAHRRVHRPPVRLPVQPGRDHRPAPRRDRDARLLRLHRARVQPHLDRGDPHHRRLLGERHRRHLRPHPREPGQVQGQVARARS